MPQLSAFPIQTKLAAKADVGLGNVDNTSDLAKPISTATQAALDGKLSTFNGRSGPAIMPQPGDYTFSLIGGLPTSLAGYGILDAAPLSHVGAGSGAHASVVAGGAAGFMSGADKTKLDSVAAGATANSADIVLLARNNHTGTQLAATISDFSAAADARIAAASINALSDVVITAPAIGQVLKWNGSAFVNDVDATTGGGGATNLSATAAASTVTVVSDTGTDAVLPAATVSAAGVMTAADKTKLDGVGTGATANSSDAQLRDRATHTGTQPASTISDFSPAADARIAAASVNALADVTVTAPSVGQVLKWNGSAWINDTDTGSLGTTNLTFSRDAATVTVLSDTGTDATVPAATVSLAGVMSSADKTKLESIAAGATANSPDATLLDRGNHTGSQLAATISDLAASVRGTLLTGLAAGSAVPIAATDSILAALAKLQAQITALGAGGGGVTAGTLQFGGVTLEYGGVPLEFTTI